MRAVSPLNAVVAELRDVFLNDLIRNVSVNVRRRIVRILIEEVGRAAIELYSGRLRADAATLANIAATEGLTGVAAEARQPGALRILVAGQTKAGKSTLVNKLLGSVRAGVDVLPLTRDYEGYELCQEKAPPAWLIDSPGIGDDEALAETARRALLCDLVIWVVAAHRADRALDRRALDALREQFAADRTRRMPPLVVVASHIDRLSPMREWNPPYELEEPKAPKAQTIRDALEAIAADLILEPGEIVPARLDTNPPYNVDLLWLRLAAAAPEAERARWTRILQGAVGQKRWAELRRQLAGSGRMLGRLLQN
jgi:predicted GTPase